jgi:hypothetical protein
VAGPVARLRLFGRDQDKGCRPPERGLRYTLSEESPIMRRRRFLQAVAGATVAPLAARAADQPKKMIALQLDAVGLVDEGIEQVLDVVQERACVNILLLDTFWFSRGTTERELEGDRYRGHGKRDQNSKFRGGHMGTVHPEYYRDTGIDPRRLAAPEPKGRDILAALAAAARKRGVQTFCLIKDTLPEQLPESEKLREQDFNGKEAETSCKNNPYYRNLLIGMMEDLIRSYDVGGIMYMAERQGAFTDTLGIRFRGVARGLPGSRTCFCEFCREKGKIQGIRFDRVMQAYQELEKFVAAGRASRRPVDGYYVTLWRLMLRYPELLMWEHLWYEGLREVYQLLYGKVKSTRASVLFGSHIWPNNNMSPMVRAEQDISQLAGYHDFIKVAMYHNCGGPRIASYIDSVSQTIWGDVPPDELLQFHYRILNYDEAPYSKVRQSGLKRDFVYRESKRAAENVRGSETLVFSGIDIDIPVLKLDLGPFQASEVSRSTRQDVRQAVTQAFQAGVHGIVISREYTEMQLENLNGVGDSIRELRLKT